MGRYLAGSMLLGGLLTGVNNLLMFWGVQFTTGGVAAVVYATVPLLVVLAGLLLGSRERLGAATFLALSLGLIGVLVLELTASGGGVITNDWAIPAIVGGASAQATGTVLIVRYHPRAESPDSGRPRSSGARASPAPARSSSSPGRSISPRPRRFSGRSSTWLFSAEWPGTRSSSSSRDAPAPSARASRCTSPQSLASS